MLKKPAKYPGKIQPTIAGKSYGAKAEKAMEPLGMSLGHDYMDQVTQCGISLRGLACTPPKTNRSTEN